MANPQYQPFHCIYGVAAIFNCHTFCGYAPHAFGTLPVPLRYTAKEPSQLQHSNKKPLHSNHHHRSAYASIKIGGSYLNIMLPHVFASHSLPARTSSILNPIQLFFLPFEGQFWLSLIRHTPPLRFCHGFCTCPSETAASPKKYQNKAHPMQSSKQQGFFYIRGSFTPLPFHSANGSASLHQRSIPFQFRSFHH